ncbi:MAG: zinc-ribbon domain-containing protein [Sporolactobacillus sp.]
MPEFCTHCGSPLAPNDRFCTSCGFPVADSATEAKLDQDHIHPSLAPREGASVPGVLVPPATDAPSRTASHHSIKIKKKMAIPIFILCVLLIGLYCAGRLLTTPQHTVQAFKDAVRSENIGKLKTLIHPTQSDRVNTAQVRAMLNLFKSNPTLYASITRTMEDDAAKPDRMPADGDQIYSLQKEGTLFFIFDNYKIDAIVLHPKVETNLKGIKIGVRGSGASQTAGKASGSAPQTLTLSGVIPGKYTFYGHSKVMNMTRSQTITSADDRVIFSGVYLSIDSNIPGAHLFVNNEDTGKTISQMSEYGPLLKTATPTFYAVYTVGGTSIRSEATIKIVSPDSNINDDNAMTMSDAQSNGIDLSFSEAEADDFYALDEQNDNSSANKKQLNDYFQSYFDALSSAVNDGDTDDYSNYFISGSDLYNSSLQAAQKFNSDGVTEDNQSYTVDAVKYTGKDTFSVDMTEQWQESVPNASSSSISSSDDGSDSQDDGDNGDDGGTTEKTYTLKTNYQLQETAPGKLMIIGEKTGSKSYQ